jgi:hypothetical protein
MQRRDRRPIANLENIVVTVAADPILQNTIVTLETIRPVFRVVDILLAAQLWHATCFP